MRILGVYVSFGGVKFRTSSYIGFRSYYQKIKEPIGLEYLVYMNPVICKNPITYTITSTALHLFSQDTWAENPESCATITTIGGLAGVTPPKFNIATEKLSPKRKVVFRPSMFRGFVKLQVCVGILPGYTTMCLETWA